jgi:hypothetical protein
MAFCCATSTIASSIKFPFHPYEERPKWSSFVTYASFLVRAAPGLRGGLEHELLWDSTLVTRTDLASSLLLYMDTLVGLLYHAMHQS